LIHFTEVLFDSMTTPKSFKPHHGCFSRFHGCLGRLVDLHLGEWIEAVSTEERKKRRSTRFTHCVAFGPSNNQARTNLTRGHGMTNYVMIGGSQVWVPSSGITYSWCTKDNNCCKKWREESSKIKTWIQESKVLLTLQYQLIVNRQLKLTAKMCS
jgi:hypothetical protein